MTNHAQNMVLDLHTDVHVTSYVMYGFSYCIREVFHVYLNKFEIAVTHSFLVIFQKIDLHKLV